MATAQRKFAICRRDCKINLFPDFDNLEIDLSCGELVEILSRKDDKCQIKIRNFDKWSDEMKINVYLCPIENLIFVCSNLWPFLIAIKDPIDRINLAADNNLRDLIPDIEINSEITISHNAFKTAENGLCKVHYKSIIPEYGLGFYFIIELISENICNRKSNIIANKYIQCKTGTTYIIVTASWLAKYMYIPKTCTERQTIQEKPKIEHYSMNFIETDKNINKIQDSNIQRNDGITKEKNPSENSKIIPERNSIWRCPQCLNYSNNVEKKCEACPISNLKSNENEEGFMSHNESFKCLCCDRMYRKGIILRNCLHIFCVKCLTKTITMNFTSDILCPDPECRVKIQDCEIRSIGGESCYREFLDRRMKESHIDTPRFVCKKCSSNCYGDEDGVVDCQCHVCGHCSVCETVHFGQNCDEYQTCKETEDNFMSNNEINTSQNDYDRDNSGLLLNKLLTECKICHNFVKNGIIVRDCSHTFCPFCLKNATLSSSECGIKCPFDDCQADLQDREIKAIAGKEFYEKILEKRFEESLRNDDESKFDCKNCQTWSFIDDCGVNFNCPNCGHCSVCVNLHYDMNCEEYFSRIDIR